MPGSVLERLHTLPDLVIVEVLALLPMGVVLFLARCAEGELRDLALRQQWRHVSVGEFFATNVDWLHTVRARPVDGGEFDNMVQTGTPPPARIRTLCYGTRPSPKSQLFMTRAWREYVATYVAKLGLEFELGSGASRYWIESAPHLHEFHLDALVLRTTGWSSAETVASQLAAGTLPNTLTRLYLDWRGGGQEALSTLLFPESVVHLRISTNQGIDPDTLPALLPRLKSLQFRAPEGLDMSPYTGMLPKSLRGLVLETISQCVTITSAAVARLSPDLAHNMLVYTQGTGEAGFPGFSGSSSTLYASVDLAQPGDYSGVVLTPWKQLHVSSGGLLQSKREVVALRALNHWFPRLERLELRLPLSLSGIAIPPSVEVWVVARCALPPAMCAIPRITRLDLGRESLWTIPADVGRMKFLTHLSLMVDMQRQATVPAIPSLESVKMYLVDKAVTPDLRLLLSITRIDIKHTPLCRVDVSCLPPGVVELSICLDWSANVLERHQGHHASPKMDLRHLAHMQSLVFTSAANIDMHTVCLPPGLQALAFHSTDNLRLGRTRYPDSLRTLKCVSVGRLSLEHFQMPHQLTHLEMSCCLLANPSTTRRTLFSGQRTPPIPEFPQTLQHLDLSGSQQLARLTCTAFPPLLRHLKIHLCGISDITPYRFPRSLDSLDVSHNNFPLPPDYDWPPVLQLCISGFHHNGYHADTVVALGLDDLELLKRCIPGVLIRQ